MTNNLPAGWLSSSNPTVLFEDNHIGRMKREIFEADEAQLDAILAEYGMAPGEVPPVEWSKPGSYIQMMTRRQLIEERRKNDIILIPIGCTENHGLHLPSATDTLFVSQIIEGVRRYTAKKGYPVALTLPPLNYGAHPYHHYGMPGTAPVREDIVRETLIDMMLGLWNDGFRKQILINNHGHLWMLESVIKQFQKRYQLPGIFRVMDWHRAVRESFYTNDRGGDYGSNFVHAEEAETSLALYLFPDMVEMDLAVNTKGKGYLPDGHFDTSVDPYHRPSKWSEGEGHFGIELFATPEGVVGNAADAEAWKAKRPLAAILRYLTILIDDIRAVFPPGTVPPVEEVTLRTAEEMEPYLREPQSEGWKPVYALPRIGQSNIY
ncbi:MAG TPA: creatininase family protein [Caldilineae bacterium]|nr:creatininase family protein [Caldilineae bacterium]